MNKGALINALKALEQAKRLAEPAINETEYYKTIAKAHAALKEFIENAPDGLGDALELTEITCDDK